MFSRPLDSLYAGSEETDLDRFGKTLCDVQGSNPFLFQHTDIRLIYDYLNRRPLTYRDSLYNPDPFAPVGYKVDQPLYIDDDRKHVDFYIYAPRFVDDPPFPNYGGDDPSNYATAPSRFTDPQEDVSTGHPALLDSVRHDNSVMIPGPKPSQVGDLNDATRWTRPNAGASVGFVHEFQHIINSNYPPFGPGAITELFSTTGERLAGATPEPPMFDVPYTWNLLGEGGRPPNFAAFSSFGAYVAFNFRGVDLTSAGRTDDLLWRWAAGPTRNLSDLVQRLAPAECAECTTKTYFNGLSPTDRFHLLLHNWRVANFVNNVALADSQYGFVPPPQLGFDPARDLGSWQNVDGDAGNDSVAVPHEVTVTSAQITRDLSFAGPAGGPKVHALGLERFGSDYWVVRSDPALASANRDLIVRVAPEGACSGVRMMASAVGYSQQPLPGDSLWKHPEWAGLAVPPKWVDVNPTGAQAVELVVPNFGQTHKAVLVVVTTSQVGDAFGTTRILPYRLNLALRTGAYQSPNPLASFTGPSSDNFPAWHPSGDTLAFFRSDNPGVTFSQIHRKSVNESGSVPLVQPAQPHSQFNPDWSPRGDWVVFDQESTAAYCDIVAYHTATREIRRLATSPDHEAWAAFSPNGQQVAYVRIRSGGASSELHRVNLDGSNDILLLQQSSPNITSPRWSPDGQAIYFTRNNLLYAVPSGGGAQIPKSNLIPQASAFDLSRGNGRIVAEDTWSPPNCGVGVPPGRIIARDTTAGASEILFWRSGFQLFAPRWSFDGTRVAYASFGPGGERDLYVGQVSYNHAPRFLGLGDVALGPGTPFQMTVNATDADGESLTYDVPSRYWPPGAGFNSTTRVFSWPNPGPQGSEHFVVFRALDPSGGVATQVVRFTVTLGAIADLNADLVGETEVWVTWTAPGQGSSQGVEYDLRYAQFPMTEYTFANGSRVTTSPPGAPGAPESQAVTGLSSCTPYWFAIKTKDSFGTWSALSNVLDTPTMCGGGGGGFRAQRAGSPRFSAGGAPLAGVRPGSPDPAQAALAIEMSLPDGIPRWSLGYLSADEVGALAGADSASILLQTPGEDGAWHKRVHIVLATGGQRLGVRAFKRAGRIVFLGPYDLQQTWSAVEFDSPGRDSVVSIAAAHSSRRGDVRSSIDAEGSPTLDLAAGDTLLVAYAPGMKRDVTPQGWFFIVGPPGSEVAAAGLRRPGLSEQAPLPAAFALRQNHPNPFAGRTTIRFELPVASPVRLEVFDLQGRRVAVLAEGQLAPGYHAIAWNRLDGNGTSVRSGVYLYRLTAGTFRDQKKMALLSP